MCFVMWELEANGSHKNNVRGCADIFHYREPDSDRSEGLDLNGICYPCVMGWGLAGTGNSSAVAVAAAAVAP